MTISEMIYLLNMLKDNHGDLECGVNDQDDGAYPVRGVTFEDYHSSGMDGKPFILIAENLPLCYFKEQQENK